jgi:ribosomal-protein-alanine N-acetyltransferase
MIVIRAMAADDLDRVQNLEVCTPEAPHWDCAAYERFVTAPDTKDVRYAALVAVRGHVLMGFAMARLVLDVCELESIVIAENARRMGIGRALLTAVSTWARERGALRMELEVRVSNGSAIRFYEKSGLTGEGLRRDYYRDPEEDAVLMGKRLDSGPWTVENFPQKTD